MSEASKVKSIQADVNRVKALINETNQLMNSPASTLASDMAGYLEQNASKLAAPLYSKFRTMTSSGKKETIIVGVLVMGGLFLGAKAIDGVRDAAAYAKAQKRLSAYHKELAVKQTMLIDAQQELIITLTEEVDALEEDRNEIIQTLGLLSKTLEKIKTASK